MGTAGTDRISLRVKTSTAVVATESHGSCKRCVALQKATTQAIPPNREDKADVKRVAQQTFPSRVLNSAAGHNRTSRRPARQPHGGNMVGDAREKPVVMQQVNAVVSPTLRDLSQIDMLVVMNRCILVMHTMVATSRNRSKYYQ